MFVSDKKDLDALVRKMQGAPVVAIDTEFHREKTYRAKLCLIQLATDEESAIVDPLAIGDLSPLETLFSDPGTMKVFHAASQDMEIIINELGSAPQPVFDTQIAAGLLGYSQQIGYGALVQSECGVALPKADSLTDWTRRPLSATQLEYAADDVVYLPRIYRHMVGELEEQGRLQWLSDDFEHLCDPATYRVDPDQMWHKIKRVGSLTRKQLCVLQAVAAWRERTAMNRNIPRRWVLSDELIVEIAKRAPQTRESLLEVRGLEERFSERSQREIVDTVRAALATDPESWPHFERRERPARDVEGATDLMLALVRLRAKENAVTTQFITSREELMRIAEGEREGHDVLCGWRRKLVGAELLDLLDGKVALYTEDGDLKVERRDTNREVTVSHR